MTAPALVHQMSFTGSVSEIKTKMTAFEETYGWHLTTKKHRNGGIFFRCPEYGLGGKRTEGKCAMI